MKRLGIIGGIGPESTIEYYRAIVALWQKRVPDGSYPPVVINSVDLKKLYDMTDNKQYEQAAEYLTHEVGRLAHAGADCALLAANTPHLYFDKIARRASIPMISIVEATCDVAERMGVKKLGLFGTRFTMQARFYPDALRRRGMLLAVPNETEQDFLHHIYFAELVKGVFLLETREQLLTIADRMKRDDGIEALILGGTELPLILRPGMDADIPFLDTTQIHVDAAVERMLA